MFQRKKRPTGNDSASREDDWIKISSKQENSYSELGGPVLTPEFGNSIVNEKPMKDCRFEGEKRVIGKGDISKVS